MKASILQFILIMLRANLPLDQTMEKLIVYYDRNTLVKTMYGQWMVDQSVSNLMSSLFPWWCVYPYSLVLIPIKTVAFVEAIQEYIQYRSQYIKTVLNIVLYPLLLLVFSMGMLGLLVFFGQPTAIKNIQILSQIGGLVLGLEGVFLTIFLYVVFALRPIDILQLVLLGFRQGWSMHQVFEYIVLNGRVQKKWRAIYFNHLDQMSFVNAFDLVFRLPLPIKESLRSFELSGQLQHGLHMAIPMYESLLMKKVKWVANLFKISIYLYLIGFILAYVAIIYEPFNQLATPLSS